MFHAADAGIAQQRLNACKMLARQACPTRARSAVCGRWESMSAETASDAAPSPNRSRGTLPTIFAVIVIDLIGFGVVLPILPYYAREYGAAPAVLGLLVATHAAMQFVFSPVWGRVSDRVGRRPVMLVTILGTAVSLYVLGAAESLSGLFVARALSGF